MNTKRASLFACMGAFSAAIAAILPACSSIDPDEVNNVTCPSGESFRAVSAVMERRCGTLDCHGHVARPLRIYGQYGLRRPEPSDSPNVNDYAQYYPGGREPTTQAELDDNLLSFCGLEPEIMTDVVNGDAEPDELVIVRKARLEQKHKGGLIWFKGTEGDRCLTSWLDGSIAELGTGSCEDELTRNR